MALRYTLAALATPSNDHALATPSPLIALRNATPSPIYTVTRVIDGDTVEIAMPSWRIRLAGLDNPEIRHPGRQPEPAGYLCRAALIGLCLNHEVMVYPDPAQPALDAWGRHIAFLALTPSRVDVGEALIRAGWAWPTPWHKSIAQALYRQALRFALEAHVGLWSDTLPVPRGAHAERILRRFAKDPPHTS